MNTKAILSVLIALATASVESFADWSCTTAVGDTYRSSQRVMSDECTNQDTGEVRPPEKPLQIKPKPFKSNPVAARKAMADGKKSVESELKDPDSAKYRNLKTSRDFVLCGEVNGKNTFGGYVGFKRFIALGGTGVVFFEDETRGFQDHWLTTCDGYDQKDLDAVRAQLRQ